MYALLPSAECGRRWTHELRWSLYLKMLFGPTNKALFFWMYCLSCKLTVLFTLQLATLPHPSFIYLGCFFPPVLHFTEAEIKRMPKVVPRIESDFIEDVRWMNQLYELWIFISVLEIFSTFKFDDDDKLQLIKTPKFSFLVSKTFSVLLKQQKEFLMCGAQSWKDFWPVQQTVTDPL